MVLEFYSLLVSKPIPVACLEKGTYSGYESTLCQFIRNRRIYIIANLDAFFRTRLKAPT